MSVDTPYVFPDNRRGTLDGLIQAAKELLRSRGEPTVAQQQHRHDLAVNARELAGTVAARVRQQPIPPALILLGVGIGLTLLLNKRARGAALSVGSLALNEYRKRLH